MPERRNCAVLGRAQSFEDALPRVYDEVSDAAFLCHRLDERAQGGVVVDLVHAYTAKQLILSP